ncbi:YesL family protein [Streptomyces radicis]|nr:DUF624 domain-containing protein [Streptomyces radicis]
MEKIGLARPAAVDDVSRSGEHWTIRLYEACSVVSLMARLNALWLLFTLLGGVVLGAAPATVAAAHCVREHLAGRPRRPVATFARTWRAELVGANVALLPPAVLGAALGWNYVLFSAAGPEAAVPRLSTLAALVVLVAVGCWLPGLYVHYDVPRRQFLTKGLRFALANPVPSVLQLLVPAALAYASSRLTILPLLVAVGAWCFLSTWLALRFFAENESRLADPRPAAKTTP